MRATKGMRVPIDIILTSVMRGFAVISRAAGLVAHIVEEQKSPSGRFIWNTIEHAIPFVSAANQADGV